MRRQVNFLMGRDDMRRLVLILMSIFLTSMAAHAITVIDNTDGKNSHVDLGNIPIGETRDITYLLGTPGNANGGVTQFPLSYCDNGTVKIVRCERSLSEGWSPDPAPIDDPGAFQFPLGGNCGTTTTVQCFEFRVTSRVEDLALGQGVLFFVFYSNYNIFGYDAAGKAYYVGGQSYDLPLASISYRPVPSPVPVPAALPLLASGFAGLGVMRKRRKKA
jgi:hypothetical protein